MSAIVLPLLAAVAGLAPGDGDGPLLEVHEVATGARVAKAEVRFLDLDRGSGEQSLLGLMEGTLQRVDRDGVRLETGEDGRTRLPAFRDEAIVVVHARGQIGGLKLTDPCDPQVVVTLQPAHDVEVEVVDERGALVPGAIVRAVHPGEFSSVLLWEEVAAGGRLRIPDPTPWHFGDEMHAPTYSTITAACSAIGGERARTVVVAADRDPSVPIRLTVPPTGALRVTLSLPPGTSLPPESLLVAWPLPPESIEMVRTIPRVQLALTAFEREHASCVVRAATEVLPSIGLGTKVGLVWISSVALPFLQVVDGPRVAGEVRDVTFDVTSLPPSLRLAGLAADAKATPLAGRELLLEQRSDEFAERERTRRAVRTDGAGRFELSAGFDLFERGESGRSWIVVSLAGDRCGDLLASPPLAAPPPDPANRCDLGSILLAPPPVWFRGHVADREGRPLAASVSFETPPFSGREGDFEGRMRFTMRPACRGNPRRFKVRCDRNGDFVVFGPPGGDSTSLEFRHEGYTSVTRKIEAPAGDHVIPDVVLEREVTLHGRLGFEGELPPGLFAIETTGPAVESTEDSSRRDWERWRNQPDAFGGFTVESLRPGALHLCVREMPTARKLYEETVEVKAATREDAHLFLPVIHLEGMVKVVRLRLAVEDLDPDDRAVVVWRHDEKKEWSHAHGALRDGFVVPASEAPFEAAIHVARHRLVRLSEVSADREVKVRLGIPLQVEVEFDSPLPAKSHVGIGVKPVVAERPRKSSDDSDRVPSWEERQWEVVDGAAPHHRFLLPVAGRYRFEVGVYSAGAGFPDDVELDAPPAEVVDSDAEQVVTLHVTAEQLERALQGRH